MSQNLPSPTNVANHCQPTLPSIHDIPSRCGRAIIHAAIAQPPHDTGTNRNPPTPAPSQHQHRIPRQHLAHARASSAST
ncbi:MAG: hypothetical protein K0U66_11070 [Gammaproteobacteria bacterium]|nr:hypothetical protein [Gammaproteobacteria bacterium]